MGDHHTYGFHIKVGRILANHVCAGLSVVKINYISDRFVSIHDCSVNENRMTWNEHICYNFTQEWLTFKLLFEDQLYIYLHMTLDGYCYLVIYINKQLCDHNLVGIKYVWFLLFFKWNSSEVWRSCVLIWNFYNKDRIKKKTYFLARNSFGLYDNIRSKNIISLGYIQICSDVTPLLKQLIICKKSVFPLL